MNHAIRKLEVAKILEHLQGYAGRILYSPTEDGWGIWCECSSHTTVLKVLLGGLRGDRFQSMTERSYIRWDHRETLEWTAHTIHVNMVTKWGLF